MKNAISQLRQEIRETFAAWTAAIDAFRQDQFNVVPFEGSWTPGQVAEHMIKAVSVLPDAHTAVPGRPYDQHVKMIADTFLDFSTQMKSPDFVLPDGIPQDKGQVIDLFHQKQAYLENVLATKDLTELCLDFELPVVGKLTRFEWIKFFVFHLQRHTHQLRKILAVTGH